MLIDAGISCKETEKRMENLGLSMNKIKAIFISHEHSDHIKGAEMIAKKYAIPVYITDRTLETSKHHFSKSCTKTLDSFVPVELGDLTIIGFPKEHDAKDPQSFIVCCKGIQIGIFTDIGLPCKQVVHYFKNCHAAFLESNYDLTSLENGNYPLHLKQRIKSDKGHLSNDQALSLFSEYRATFMSHLILSHLSKENNSPQLVEQLFKNVSMGTEIIVASRYKETALYFIPSEETITISGKSKKERILQLELFT